MSRYKRPFHRRRLTWPLLTLVALLLSGCAAVSLLHGGWQVLGWLLIAALLGACIPDVETRKPNPFSIEYVADFNVSSLSTANGGDGSKGFIVQDLLYSGRTGSAVAAGDLNGDGFADIAVGSPYVNVGAPSGGQVSIVHGHGGSFGPTIEINTISPGQGRFFWNDTAADRLGTSVAIVPSINADALPDLVVGAPQAAGAGRAIGVFGAPTLPPSNLIGTLIDGTTAVELAAGAGTRAGQSVAGGDINGDGLGDVAIGAHLATVGGANAGRLYEVQGRTTGWGSGTYAMNGGGAYMNRFNGISGPSPNLGYSLAGGGDLDGDEFDDLLISARYTAGNWRVFARFGNVASNQYQSLTALASTFALSNDEANDQHGFSMAMGDVNGDGLADIVAGARFANRFIGSGDPADQYTGRVHVAFGSPGLPASTLAPATFDGTNGFSLTGVSANEILGSSVAVGDVNGDGIGDILAAASPGNEPVVYVIFGKSGAVPALCHLSQFAAADGILLHTFGYTGGESSYIRSIAVADVDGDGYNDIVLGWPSASAFEGRVFVIFNKALQK